MDLLTTYLSFPRHSLGSSVEMNSMPVTLRFKYIWKGCLSVTVWHSTLAETITILKDIWGWRLSLRVVERYRFVGMFLRRPPSYLAHQRSCRKLLLFSSWQRMLGEAYVVVVARRVSHWVGVVLSSLRFTKAVSNYPLINLVLTWHLIVKYLQFSEILPSDVGFYHYHPIVSRV
jgi:hypothetical protein